MNNYILIGLFAIFVLAIIYCAVRDFIDIFRGKKK